MTKLDPQLLRRCGEQLNRLTPTRRRAIAPVMIACFAALWAGKDALVGSSGPSSANAAVVSIANPASGFAGTDSSSVTHSALEQWLSTPVGAVGRNLFRLPDNKTVPPTSVLGAASGQKAPEITQKNASVSADGSGQNLHESTDGQARQIRLQSTLDTPAGPTALVNGKLVREGDVVASGSGDSRVEFRVQRIEARRVLIEIQGERFEVRMDSPDAKQ